MRERVKDFEMRLDVCNKQLQEQRLVAETAEGGRQSQTAVVLALQTELAVDRAQVMYIYMYMYVYVDVQPIPLGVTFSNALSKLKAQSSKLERLFSLKRGKRDVRALSFERSKMSHQVGLAVYLYLYK